MGRFKHVWRGVAAFGLASTMTAAPVEAALSASDSFHTTTDGAGGTYNVNHDLSSVSNALWGQDATSNVTGFLGAWGGNGTATNDLRVSTDSLSHGLVVGGTSPGQLITRDAGSTNRGTYRELATIPESGQYYASFLLEVGSNPDVNLVSALGLRELAGNRDWTIDNTALGGVSVGFNDTDISVWVNGVEAQLLANFTPDETYFTMIATTDNGAGSNDSITVTLFDSANTDLLNPTAEVLIDNADVTGRFTHLAFQKHGVGDPIEPARFDEFRFGTEATDVVVPEPASLALLSAGGLLMLRRRRPD